MHERLNRQERKAQTRERLLDAATEVFAELGFENASLDEVAAAAGYTKGAVYSNFASKTDLLIALMERRIATQNASYTERFEGQDAAAVAADLLSTPDEIPDSEKKFAMLAMEVWLHAMRDEKARRLVAEQYENARQIVADFLVSWGYGTTLPDAGFSPREVAILIEALGTGLSLQAAIDPEHVRLGLWAEALAKLLALPLPPQVPEASGAEATSGSRS
jgi:AcrR family transcriptional regulator